MRRRDWLAALLIAFMVGASLSLFSNRLSGLSIDFLFWLRERVFPESSAPQSSPTVIVAIDEETYRRPPFVNVPYALWTHEIAAVLDALSDAKAKVVGFDVVFPTSMDRYVSGFDRPFLVSLHRAAVADKVVLGEVQLQETPIQPFPAQMFAVGGDRNVRFANLIPDQDGVIRRAPIVFRRKTNASEVLITEPAFAATLAERAGANLPNGNSFLINFHDLDAIPAYSLADLVACATAGKSEFFRAHFAGKVVVLGVVLDVEDRKLTSMRLVTRPEHGANGARCLLPSERNVFREDARRDTIPGAYVMATAVNNLIEGDQLSAASRIETTAIILVAALTAAFIGLVLRPAMMAAACFCASLIWAAATTVAFQHQSVLPLLAPPIAAGLCVALVTGYRFGVADRDKRLLRRSFAFYLAPTLIDRMLTAQKLPELGGETRFVTILLADLAGFTALSEPLKPPTLVAIINAYFTAMSEIIESEGGFVQDYAGDALLAIFGAPLDDPAHAEHATVAALRCRDRIAALVHEHVPLRGRGLSMRIGLNSGEVLVGNIGSTRRLKYTAMGDAVNLAARLETANKLFGTAILSSGATKAAAGAGFSWRRIDCVRVVGRAEPVDLWEPLGLANQVAPEALARAKAYEEALKAYRAGDFETARSRFRALAVNDSPARLLTERLAGMTRPPPGWDGVTELTTK